eukprot:TRINITY_DN10204_c0_g1_i1.p1 TRINITY_DN10204_c0_g1~~TRINITY_DN10204_c0_g1_i1.p1  ORF type:complete len:399 (-),score=76.92 TRINITY_DN10204_c0_g1_i1:34-1173(-)
MCIRDRVSTQSTWDKKERVYTFTVGMQITLVLRSPLMRTLRPLLLLDHNFSNGQAKSITTTLEQGKTYNILEVKEEFTFDRGYIGSGGEWEWDVKFLHAGRFLVQIVWTKMDFDPTDATRLEVVRAGRPEIFVVEPTLLINGKEILPNALSKQTLLPRCMGPVSRWSDVIAQSVKAGYNCFHLAPIQYPGFSGSLYSIKDQLCLNPQLFPGVADPAERFQILKRVITDLKQKYGVLFFIDMVLNHTSVDSEWVRANPSVCYTTENTPSLRSAYKLDRALVELNLRLLKNAEPDYKKGPLIENVDDVNQIVWIIREKILTSLRLEEYFLFNVEEVLSKLRVAFEGAGLSFFEEDSQLERVLKDHVPVSYTHLTLPTIYSV